MWRETAGRSSSTNPKALLLKVCIGAGLILFLVKSGRLSFSGASQLASRFHFLLLGLLLLILVFVIGTVRWWCVLRSEQIEISLLNTGKLEWIGCFFNNFMPTSVGGDVFKAYYVARDYASETRAEAVATVLIDRLLGVGGLALLLLIIIPLNLKNIFADQTLKTFALLLAADVVGAGFIVFFMVNPRYREWRAEHFASLGRWGKALVRADEAFGRCSRKPRLVVALLLISAAGHLAALTAIFLAGRALGAESITYSEFLLVVPLGFVGNSLPISPMGLGVGEVCFEALLALRGVSHGAEMLLLWRLGMAAVSLPGFIFFVAAGKIEDENGED